MPAPVPTDELLDRLAALLEDASDALEVELVLGALATLDDPARLRSLTRRAGEILRRGPREGVTPLWLRGQLARLVLPAADHELPPRPTSSHAPVGFLVRRLAHVEAVLRGRHEPRPLVATPDDTEGWISASTLVERLVQRDDRPATCDLVAALLRVHPDGRADALRSMPRDAGALRGPLQWPVRHALGAPPPSPAPAADAVLADAALWVAASRARVPTSADPWLATQGVEGAGRSEPIDAALVFDTRTFTWDDRGRPRTSSYWTWTVEVVHGAADVAADVEDLEPTAVPGSTLRSHDQEDLVGWLAMIWPHDCEHFLVDAVHAVVWAATSTDVSHDAVRVLRAVADHPGRTGPLSTACLAAGLSAAKPDQRAAAVDAVLQRRAAGRLGAEQLAAGLVCLRGPATLTRLAATLRDVAADDGGACRTMIIDALAATLPRLDRGARGLHALVELLREELIRAGRPVPAEITPWLAQLRGSSRAARAAKALLETP